MPPTYDPIVRDFGFRVRSLREAAGYSQESFAEMAGFGRSFYGRIERGEANVTLQVVARIASALDIPIAKLFPED